MNKLIVLFSLLCLSVSAVQSQCPFGGKENCKGECGRFIDENGDGYCDNSIIRATEKPLADSTAKKTEQTMQNARQKDNKSEAKTEVMTKKDAGKGVKTESSFAVEDKARTVGAETVTEEVQSEESGLSHPAAANAKPYRFVGISVATLLLYCLTSVLVFANKMKKTTHKKIWNVLLLLTCLVSCLLGFFLVIQINYHFATEWLRSILKIHVEFGIAMTIIAVIHILWHTNYYSKIFSRGK